MAKLLLSAFSRYEFASQEELWRAQVLNEQQKQYIQTLLCDAATEKVNLDYDPDSPKQAIRRAAILDGQISVYSALLSSSDEAQRNLVDNLQEN